MSARPGLPATGGPAQRDAGLGGLLADLPRLARALGRGDVLATDVMEAYLARIAAVEPRVRAFAWLDAERARRLAAEADRRRAAGEKIGPLHGVPLGIKDVLETSGIPTEHGSAAFAGHVPDTSAGAVRNLEVAGALVIGKTVTAELAYFSPGPTRNPWDLERTPGGSSMGSAAAVAAGMVPGAIGTQTNGSVVRPAAFCGVVGYKPSQGRIPGDGVLVFSHTLDQVGCFASSVAGVALLADAMAGNTPEPLAPTATPPRLAVVRTGDWEHAERAMRQRFEAAVLALAAAGADVQEIPLPPEVEESPRAHRIIMAVEAWQHLGALVATHGAHLSEVLRDFVAEGRAIPDATYRAALRTRDQSIRAFRQWMAQFDAMLTPPAVGEAPGPATTGDPRFCTRWTLLGAPALSLPIGLGPHGLPLGLQVAGVPGGDTCLVATAAWVEAALPGPGVPPL